MTTASKIPFVQVDADKFKTEDGRFSITAERTAGGYIRKWELKENFVLTLPGSPTPTKLPAFSIKGSYDNKNAVRMKIASILATELPKEKWEAVVKEVKLLLHAACDTQRNRGQPTEQAFGPLNLDWVHAYGILNGLAILGYMEVYGKVGGNDLPVVQDVMQELIRQVKAEEDSDGQGRCEHCLKKYGKDDRSVRESKG